ncbi:Omp28-related outer membrane protein [bacterium]|nr:Omp28-related outer membrane protein [bacterium]
MPFSFIKKSACRVLTYISLILKMRLKGLLNIHSMRVKYYMMTAALAILGTGNLLAQSFSDDFESYAVGDYLAKTSPNWTTWNNAPGGKEDVKITDTDAHSGTNSVYFNGAASSGGPTDLVLPFGSKYDIGHFSYEMMMKIEKGKGAYFNFQAEVKTGTTWALSWQADGNGNYEMFDDNGYIFKSNTCPTATWFNARFEIDLSTNQWTFYIDDKEEITWKSATNSIASIDIFPVNNFDNTKTASYWVDDVMYEYTTPSLSANDLAATNVSLEGVMIAGENVVPTAQIRNLGTKTINSAELYYTYNGNTTKQTFSGLNLASTKYATVTFDKGFTLNGSGTSLEVGISQVDGANGDDVADDDKMSIPVTVTVPAADKMVVVEEGTGTWCGWCPRGAVSLETLEEKYGDLFQGIAVHNGDPMQVDAYEGPFVAKYVSGFPSGQIMRSKTLSMNPGEVEAAFLEAIVKPAAAKMAIGANYNEGAKTLTVSVDYTFKEAVTGNWRIACVLVENNVRGDVDGYSQSNYYSGGGNGTMGGYESKPSKVPYTQMVYNDVARAISPSVWGSDMLPDAIAANETHTYQFSFYMKDYWNTDNLQLVALCINPDGTINNAASATLTDAMNNGLNDGEIIAGVTSLDVNQLLVYPNPANDVLLVKGNENFNVQIVNMQGQQVATGEGKTAFHQIDVSHLSEGVYFVRIIDGNTITTKKILIQ